MTDSRLSKTNSYKFTCSRSDCLVLENRRFSRAVANSATGQALRTSAALFLVTHLEGRILPDVRLCAVIRLRPVPVSTNLARLSSQRVRPAPQANRPGAGGRAHQWAVFGSKGSSAGRRYGMNCAIPLRAMAAACRRPDGFQLKPAFFPNNPSEEFERQSVCRRGQNHALGVNQAG